jgi:hypothetical protein
MDSRCNCEEDGLLICNTLWLLGTDNTSASDNSSRLQNFRARMMVRASEPFQIGLLAEHINHEGPHTILFILLHADTLSACPLVPQSFQTTNRFTILYILIVESLVQAYNLR